MALLATMMAYASSSSTTPVRDNAIHKFQRASCERLPHDLAISEYLRNLEIKYEWKRTLRSLRELGTGWDSYEAPPPSDLSLGLADKFLDLLSNERMLPASIVASAEGGVGICFKTSDSYADIEFLNSGEIVGVYYSGGTPPHVWETESSEAALTKSIKNIREYIQS